ncbi:MAG TPA: type VI secretion system tube protein Hcp [Armatimonadota bacterium]|jgi:type VI secretion system secreted protein Hcp
MAAVDYFLMIDGIPGESADEKHPNEIEVISFSFGVTQAASASPAAGGPVGKVQFQPFSISKRIDTASPKLFQACASGQHIKTAVLSARKTGEGSKQDFLVYRMTDVVISSYQTSGAAGELPVDQLSLVFAQISWTYQQTMPTGGLNAPVGAGWNLVEGRQA